MSGGEQWLERRELAVRMNWSARTIERKEATGEIAWRLAGRTGRNGRPMKEYLVPGNGLARRELPEGEAQARPMPFVSEEQQPLVGERKKILAPMIALAAREPMPEGFEGFITLRQAASAIARQRGLNERRVWRWWGRWKKHGDAGLVRKPRADRGQLRRLSYQAAIDLRKLWADCQGNLGAALEELRRQKGRAPSLYTARKYIASLPAALRARALKGAKGLNDRHLPYITRRNYPVNAVWVADHAQLDCFVNAQGRAVRAWITVFMDMGSRFIVGWRLTLRPDSQTIASAFRMGLARHGIPGSVYFDNGKDFKSRQVGELLARLGVPNVFATPRHPQAKPVERWFGTLHKQFDAAAPSYCGRSPEHRPESCQTDRPDELPTLAQIAVALRLWIEEEYHQRPHGGLKGRTPAEVYRPSERRITPEKLAVLMLRREGRTVERAAVRLFDRRYEHEGNGLYLHNGHRAEALWDPTGELLEDLGEVLVVCCGEWYWCRSLGEPETYEELKERLRAKKTLKKMTERFWEETYRHARVVSPGERRLRAAAAAMLPAELDQRAAERALPKGPEPPEDLAELPGEGEADEVAWPDPAELGDEVGPWRKE